MTTIKGASIWNGTGSCRAAYWYAYVPGYRLIIISFRTKASTQGAERGGSWIILAQNCRAAYRYQSGPGYRWEDLGFRTKA